MNFENMNDLKIKYLEILQDFDDFCKENSIEYRIAFGTVLGAVRHGGFIPWDDDVDVDMHIDDFAKLEKIWNKMGNKEKYFLQTKNSEPNLSSNFYRLRMNNTTCMHEIGLKVPLHWGIPLDIFPYFNSPKNVMGQKIIKFFHHQSERFSALNGRFYKANVLFKFSTKLITKFLFSIVHFISNVSKNSGLIYYPAAYFKDNQIIDKSFLIPSRKIKFENLECMGPNNPKKYLTWTYGNFMKLPPEDKRYGHKIWIIDTENDYSKYLNGTLPLPKD